MFTDHSSQGSSKAVGLLFVCLYVPTVTSNKITFNFDIWHSNLSGIKLDGQSHK